MNRTRLSWTRPDHPSDCWAQREAGRVEGSNSNERNIDMNRILVISAVVTLASFAVACSAYWGSFAA